jgi:putative sterol carrier protein
MNLKSFFLDMKEKIDPATVVGHNTNFHFDVDGEQGGQITIEIKDGAVAILDGFHGDPKCVVRSKDVTLMGILKGEINPMTALFMGKIKISNPGEMMKYAKVFGLMK